MKNLIPTKSNFDELSNFEKYNLTKLTQHGTENLNSSITIKATEYVILKFHQKKSPAQMVSQEISIKHIKKN